MLTPATWRSLVDPEAPDQVSDVWRAGIQPASARGRRTSWPTSIPTPTATNDHAHPRTRTRNQARAWTICRYWRRAALRLRNRRLSSTFRVRPERRLQEAWVPLGLIFGLIRLHSSTFIDIRINTAMQVADVNGLQRTTIPTPENRKVGGSTPPLATTSDHAKRFT
jgi:hypothetical protein